VLGRVHRAARVHRSFARADAVDSDEGMGPMSENACLHCPTPNGAHGHRAGVIEEGAPST
jgi:hypothetical protein